jgi:hypothetical protein
MHAQPPSGTPGIHADVYRVCTAAVSGRKSLTAAAGASWIDNPTISHGATKFARIERRD